MVFVVDSPDKPIFPTHCVYCKTKLKWTDGGVNLTCPNEKCSGVAFERLDRFFSKVKADGLSRKTLFKLAQEGIDSPLKVLTMKAEDIAKIDGFAMSGSKKLVASIKEAAKKADLPSVMSASGIFQTDTFGLADVRLEAIVSKLGKRIIERGTIEEIKSKIIGIAGIGKESVAIFLDKIPEFQVFMAELSTVLSFDGSNMKSTKLAGKSFAFSDFRSKELEALIKENGGKVGGVSKNTTALFTDSSTTGKAQSAIKINNEAGKEVVKVVSPQDAEAYLFNLIK